MSEHDELKEQLAKATLGTKPKLGSDYGATLTESIYTVAKKLLEESPNYIAIGDKNWYRWDGHIWEEVEKKDVDADVLAFVTDNPRLRHPRYVDQIVSSIRMQVQKRITMYGAYRKDQNIITINFPSNMILVDEEGNLTTAPHNRDLLFTSYVTHDYNREAYYKDCLYHKTLKTLMPHIENRKLWHYTLHSIFEPSQRLEFALLLLGSGSNGKSTLLESLDYAVGKQNTSAESMEALIDVKGRAVYNLRNSMVNMFMEHSDVSLENMALLRNIFSGEDVMGAEVYKKRERISPTATCIFATNHEIRISKPTYGDVRRFRYIVMEEVFRGGNKDSRMKDKLKTKEVGEQIIAYSLNDMKTYLSLNEAPFGSVPSTEVYERLAKRADPIHYFILEIQSSHAGETVQKDKIRTLLIKYLNDNKILGNQTAIENTMWKRLKSYDITTVQLRSGDDRPRAVKVPRIRQET